MAINKENIKLFASQRLTDEDYGGGRATGNVVADGQVYNLFRYISRIDRTVGDASMRKGLWRAAPITDPDLRLPCDLHPGSGRGTCR